MANIIRCGAFVCERDGIYEISDEPEMQDAFQVSADRVTLEEELLPSRTLSDGRVIKGYLITFPMNIFEDLVCAGIVFVAKNDPQFQLIKAMLGALKLSRAKKRELKKAMVDQCEGRADKAGKIGEIVGGDVGELLKLLGSFGRCCDEVIDELI